MSSDSEGPYNGNAFVSVTLPEPVVDYLDNYLLGFKPKNTYNNRRSSYRHYQIFCNERNRDFMDPSVADIEDFIAHQIKHGYKGSTVENRIYDLSSLFKYLAKRSGNPIEENPVNTKEIENIDGIRPREDISQIRYLEIEEYERLLECVEKLRDRVLIMLLWQTGLRAVEAVNLKIDEDLSREDRSITLLTAKQYEDKERTVWYKRSLERELKKWLDRGGRDKYLRADESPYLLLGKEPEQLNPRRPTEIIREYADEAGVQATLATNRDGMGNDRNKVTAHAFRHSYAVHRVKNGMPINFLRELMGHTDIQQTMEYLDVLDDDIREADEKYRP